MRKSTIWRTLHHTHSTLFRLSALYHRWGKLFESRFSQWKCMTIYNHWNIVGKSICHIVESIHMLNGGWWMKEILSTMSVRKHVCMLYMYTWEQAKTGQIKVHNCHYPYNQIGLGPKTCINEKQENNHWTIYEPSCYNISQQHTV